jgi:hypothetical protein
MPHPIHLLEAFAAARQAELRDDARRSRLARRRSATVPPILRHLRGLVSTLMGTGSIGRSDARPISAQRPFSTVDRAAPPMSRR